eukprot:g16097.t1
MSSAVTNALQAKRLLQAELDDSQLFHDFVARKVAGLDNNLKKGVDLETRFFKRQRRLRDALYQLKETQEKLREYEAYLTKSQTAQTLGQLLDGGGHESGFNWFRNSERDRCVVNSMKTATPLLNRIRDGLLEVRNALIGGTKAEKNEPQAASKVGGRKGPLNGPAPSKGAVVPVVFRRLISSTDRDYSLRVEEYRDFTRPGFPTVSDAPLVLSPVQAHTRNEHDRHPPANDDTFATDLYLFRYRFFGPADFLGQWLDVVIKWESHHLGSDFLKLTTDCNVAGVVMRLFATQKTMIEKFVAEEYDRRRSDEDGIGRSPPTEDPELTDEDVMLAKVLKEAQEIAVRYADYGTEPGEDQAFREVAALAASYFSPGAMKDRCPLFVQMVKAWCEFVTLHFKKIYWRESDAVLDAFLEQLRKAGRMEQQVHDEYAEIDAASDFTNGRNTRGPIFTWGQEEQEMNLQSHDLPIGHRHPPRPPRTASAR